MMPSIIRTLRFYLYLYLYWMNTQNKIAKLNLVTQIESFKYNDLHLETTNNIEAEFVKLVTVVH